MPNRIIKESICVSEQIDELSTFEENFFYRLLVNCDDYGCMDAREKVLAAKLYPLKILKPKDITHALDKLAEIGLIGLYEVDEHPYLKVLKWAEHQRVRISKHKYPEPAEEQLAAGRGELRKLAASCGELPQNAADRGNLRPESNPIRIQSESEYEYKSESERESESIAARVPALFDVFWSVYPKHEAKAAAQKAFDKLKPDEALVQTMVTAIEKWKQTDQWQENGGQYIPYPATWLNGKRWEDDVPQKRKAASAPAKTVVAQQYEQRDYSTPTGSGWDDFMDKLDSLMK